jgi:hypothetical protein
MSLRYLGLDAREFKNSIWWSIPGSTLAGEKGCLQKIQVVSENQKK